MVRHLVQEICVEDQYIPNDTKLNDTKIKLITGPNQSGKSVYLKQVGQIGMYLLKLN